MKRAIAWIGYLFVGLIILGLSLQIIAALRQGKPFCGMNYKGLALSTWGGAMMLLFLAAFGLVRLMQIFLGRLSSRERRD